MTTKPRAQNTAALRRNLIDLDQVEAEFCKSHEYLRFKNDSNKITIDHSREAFYGTGGNGVQGRFYDRRKSIMVDYIILSNGPDVLIFERCFIDNKNSGEGHSEKDIIRNDEELIAAIRYVAERDKLKINASISTEWFKEEIDRRGS